MATQAKIMGTSGEVSCTIVGEVQIENKPYTIVDLGSGAYVRGVFTRYLIVPPNSIPRDIPNKVEVVNE